MSFEKIHKIKTFLPCKKFIIFGLGYDSIIWKILNNNNTTSFIENDPEYIKKFISKDHNNLEIRSANYDTNTRDYIHNLGGDMYIPEVSGSLDFFTYDVVLVDAPVSSLFTRYQSISLAKVLVKPKGVIIVDDYERQEEKDICDILLTDVKF
ncbi:unnamed protein product, partial [Heterosigma akashiwo]